MLGVLTTYAIKETPYSSYIIGNDIRKIKKIAKERGLSEIIESKIMQIVPMPNYLNLSDSEFIKHLPEILHTTTFLSFIAVKANKVKASDLLGDDGLLHELTHLLANLSGCSKKSLTCVRDSLKNLQEMAIGCYEPV